MALGAALVPLRAHLGVATDGLVLVVPVVVGVAVGGLGAGLATVAAGFLIFDYVFIPPYYTLTVGVAQNWVALGVYVVVMAMVARVVARLDEARGASLVRAQRARDLFDVSELLLADRPVSELAQIIVDAVVVRLGIAGATLLRSSTGGLEVLAEAGRPVAEEAIGRLRPNARLPVALSTDVSDAEAQTLALVTDGRPVGLLVLAGVPRERALRELLPTLANHFALALGRAELNERVRQAELLEEVDRLRHALVGAVSHDLRTPLSTIKVASSTLVDASATLSRADTNELHELIDSQADRLDRIVSDILDMTRIQAGVLEVRSQPWSVLDLVAEVVAALRPAIADRAIDLDIPPRLPKVSVDHALIEHVLANLLDNADRHGPPGTPILIEAAVPTGDRVAISVSDAGPGVAADEREMIFDSFVRFDTGGRAGLGLAIAKAFVRAHGEEIWVEEAPGGGARFVFTLPIAGAEACGAGENGSGS